MLNTGLVETPVTHVRIIRMKHRELDIGLKELEKKFEDDTNLVRRIAITADVHIDSTKNERIENLNSILGILRDNNIKVLIIAGDLFNKNYEGYVNLDTLAAEYPDIIMLVVPGNHDQHITQDFFSERNIFAFSEPAIVSLEKNGKSLVLIPYKEGKTIGEIIEEFFEKDELRKKEWYLISHGDYERVRRDKNGNEGGYFPLTRTDINEFCPIIAILGHYHSQMNFDGNVVYPGSPYPCDITETGQRRVVILDTETSTINSIFLNHIPVYLQKEIFIVPDSKEKDQIESQLEFILEEEEKCYYGSDFYENLVVRLSITGYSTTRRGIEDCVRKTMIKKGVIVDKIDLGSLLIADNPDLTIIALKVRDRINSLNLSYEESEQLQKEILKESWQMIYR